MVDGTPLLPASGATEGQYPASDEIAGDAGDVPSDVLDDTDTFETGDQREGRPRGVRPGDRDSVGRIGCGGRHPDRQLRGPGCTGLGDRLHGDDLVERTRAVGDCCSHGRGV